jgi:hypothetical protein
MPVAILFGWLQRGWITGRQDTRPPYRWIITADPHLDGAVVALDGAARADLAGPAAAQQVPDPGMV